MRSALLSQLERRAREGGLDLFGVVDARRFDKAQPPEGRCTRMLDGCGTAIVLASGGQVPVSPSALGDLGRMLRGAGVRARLAAPIGSPINFACLGEAAGLGIVSPVIHRLLHPRFGPWVFVHAAVLVVGQPFGPIADASIADTFRPCCSCSRPCVSACPAGVHDTQDEPRPDRCHEHRDVGGCPSGCQVVRTCPVGADLASPTELELERHRLEARRLAYRFGRGWLAVLRRFLRP